MTSFPFHCLDTGITGLSPQPSIVSPARHPKALRHRPQAKNIMLATLHLCHRSSKHTGVASPINVVVLSTNSFVNKVCALPRISCSTAILSEESSLAAPSMMVSSFLMVSWLSSSWAPLRMVGSSDSRPVPWGAGAATGLGSGAARASGATTRGRRNEKRIVLEVKGCGGLMG